MYTSRLHCYPSTEQDTHLVRHHILLESCAAAALVVLSLHSSSCRCARCPVSALVVLSLRLLSCRCACCPVVALGSCCCASSPVVALAVLTIRLLSCRCACCHTAALGVLSLRLLSCRSPHRPSALTREGAISGRHASHSAAHGTHTYAFASTNPHLHSIRTTNPIHALGTAPMVANCKCAKIAIVFAGISHLLKANFYLPA